MESLKLGKSNILSSSRIKAAKQALEINYSREDWYLLLEARNGYPVP